MEISRAQKRRTRQEQKKQEAIDLAPARAMQPKSRTIRYDNMKSAMAEETVIGMCLREPAFFDQCTGLKPEEFSCELLGRVFGQLMRRHSEGFSISLSVLEDLSSEEASHIAGIFQRQQGPVSEQAFADCVQIIRNEHQAGSITTEDDLLAFQNKLKKRKGIKT
jgi:DNA primase